MTTHDAIARLNAIQDIEDLAYIQDQWGQLYDVIHDRIWAMRPKTDRLCIVTTGTATELLWAIRHHYNRAKA
jgi:hypothetical protein